LAYKELDAFLSKRNCSYMTSILAANNITSLRQLSFLTHQQAIYDLAQQCSSVSSKSAVAELTTLTSVIEESKRLTQLQGGAAPRNSQVRAEDFHKRYVKMRDALAK
jgi:hypothetical protein